MVTLRNTLVHHFIDQYDLWAVDGCLRAQDALNRTYAEIDRHFDQLHAFAGHMDAAKLAVAELVRAPEFQNMLTNGLGPGGTIHWKLAGILRALQQVLLDLAVVGWATLDEAARCIRRTHGREKA